jgi:hypothetical protein
MRWARTLVSRFLSRQVGGGQVEIRQRKEPLSMTIHASKRLCVGAAVLAAVVVFALGFFVALGVRSVVAGPGSAPAAAAPNPGHSWSEIGDLPGIMWHSNNDGDGSGLDSDMVDGMHASEVGGVSACFDQEVYPPGTGDQACQQADAYCVTAWNNSCGSIGLVQIPCRSYPAGGGFCARCCR